VAWESFPVCMSDWSRRSFIEQMGLLGGIGTATSLAGCIGGGGSSAAQGNTTGSSGGTGGSGQSLIIGSVFPSGHVINKMAKNWATTIQEETEINLSITIEPSFGGEQEVMEQTRIGAIGGAIIGTRWVIEYDPKNFWVESPFVFKDWKQQRRAFESKYLQDGRKRLRQEGNQVLVGPPIYRGYRHTSGNKAFKTPADIEGVNLRVPDLSPWVNIWDGLGASPTTVAFDELYSALQQGVVDAQENPAQTVLSASLYEVQDYYTLTQHHAATGWFTFNKSRYNQLSKEERTTFSQTLTENINNLTQNIKKSESQAIDKLKNQGMNIVEPDRDAWLSAAQQPIKNQFEKNWEPSLQKVRNI
jgi:TRAP-type C4-dicarboxylate transport system substrate-binding protein